MGKLVPWSKSPLEIGDVPVAIISLADAEGRRKTLIDRGFSPELVNGFWPACDMRGVPDSDLRSYSQYNDIKQRYARPPVSAELGCLLSHRAIVKWLSEQDVVSQVIVFEDDVLPATYSSFENLCDLSDSLSKYANAGNPFICHLGPRPEQWKSAIARKVTTTSCSGFSGVDLFELVDKKAGLWRAHAYIISKDAADRYTKYINGAGFLADDWQFIVNKTMSKMILVSPSLFTQDEDVESTIDPENTRVLLNAEIASTKNMTVPDWLSVRSVFQRGVRLVKRYVKALVVKFYRALPARNLY